MGKESDVHFAQGPDGELVALKLHRLGRISFRAIKEKRDYLRLPDCSPEWLKDDRTTKRASIILYVSYCFLQITICI